MRDPFRSRRLLGAVLCTVMTVSGGAPLRAQASPAGDDPAAAIAAIRQEIDALRRGYDERLAALEARLAALEGHPAPAAGEGARAATAAAECTTDCTETSDDEIAALRAAAASASGAEPSAPPAASATAGDDLAAIRAAAAATAGEAADTTTAEIAPTAPATGHERNLSQFNPEISFTGDVVASASSQDREGFDAREFELNFQSALDPYSYTKWTLSFDTHGNVDVEEGYAGYNGLPGGLQLRLGKFRQSFGVLNRWHQHALPTLDYPLVLTRYFGDEGLAQTGLSLEWLLPKGFADANEVTVQLTDGESDAFGGENFRHLAGLLHFKSYWDLSDATYLEWGLSGVGGANQTGGDTRVWGSDLTLHWQPPSRAKYAEVTWRTELLRSERDVAGDRVDALGGYTYAEALLRQNLYGGVRYDRVEDPLVPSAVSWGVYPYLTWWQSEFVRIRGEYGRVHDGATGRNENRFALQLTWAAGPHKHETY